MVLALNHDLDSSLVFAPSCRGVDTDFPAIFVNPVRAVWRKVPVLGNFREVAGLRNGAAADHSSFALRSVASIKSRASSDSIDRQSFSHCGVL
jgi:hypothetical protein